MTAPKKRRRKSLHLGRLRKSVRINNRIYGLLVQAHDALRGDVIALMDEVAGLARRLQAVEERQV